MRVNHEQPPLDVGGTIYVRKERGRKIHFVCGGPSYEEAKKIVTQRDGWIALWKAHGDSRMFYLFPDADSVRDV